MAKPLTWEQLVAAGEELRARYPAGDINRSTVRKYIKEGNVNALKKRLINAGIPTERPDTPPRPIPKLLPGKHAKTLEQKNQVLQALGYEPGRDEAEVNSFMKSQGISNIMPGVSKPSPEELSGRGRPFSSPSPMDRMQKAGKKSSESGGVFNAAAKAIMRSQSVPGQMPASPMENQEGAVSQDLPSLAPFSDVRYIPANEPKGYPASRKLMEAELRNKALRMERQTEKMSKDRRPVHERFNANPEDIQNISGSYESTHGPIPYQKQLRALGDMAFQLHDLQPYMQRVAPFADRDDLQYEAQRLRGEMSPFSDAERDKQQNLMDILNSHASSNKSLEASKPFLERMSRSPAESHQALFGEMEREALDDLYNRGTREFQEKVLPKIMNNYQTPGLRRHGQQAKDIAGAGEKFARGLQEEGTKSKIALRDMLLKHGGQHGILQAHGAGIAGKAAEKGEQNNLNALKMIDSANNEANVRKTAHIADLSNEGAANREEEQKLMNFEEQQNRAIYDKPYQDVQRTAEVLRGIPITSQTKHRIESNPPPPQDNSRSNFLRSGAKMAIGAGENFMPHKRGGRIHKAIGGQVNPMQDVIQNAVIDKIDPVTELRRMLQHTQGVQGLQARQQLKIGGMVDPIKAGAEEANMYAGHDAMKNRLHRLRNPEPESFGRGLMEKMAAAASGSPGWLGESMDAYSRAADVTKKNKASRESNLNEADKLEYELQQKLEEKAMKERDMLRLEKIANAQAAHHNAKAAGVAGGVGGVGGVKTTAALLKAKKDLNMQFNALLRYKRANEHVKKLAGTVDSGPMQDILPFNAQSYIAPMLGLKGSTKERMEMKNAGNGVMNAYQALEKSGAGRSVLHLQQKKEDKPGLTQFAEYNVSSPDKVIKGTDIELEDTIDLMRAYGFPEDVIARKIQQMADPSVPLDEEEEGSAEEGAAAPSDAASLADELAAIRAQKEKRAQGKVA